MLVRIILSGTLLLDYFYLYILNFIFIFIFYSLYSDELFLWKVRLGRAVETRGYHIVHWTLKIYTPIHIYNQLKSLLQYLLVVKYYQWDFQNELAFPELIYDQNQWTNLKLDCHAILLEILSCMPCHTWSGCDIYNFAKMSKNK